MTNNKSSEIIHELVFVDIFCETIYSTCSKYNIKIAYKYKNLL